MAIRKMREDFDPQNYCSRLNVRQTPDGERSPYRDRYGYYCLQTGNRCVGAIKSSLVLDDKLNTEIIDRCPCKKR